MIIYLASYPRSGNTWVRHLIRHYFDRRTASVYFEGDQAENVTGNISTDDSDIFTHYASQFYPSIKYQKLKNNCLGILTNEFRVELGRSNQMFFVKTHEYPYSNFFRGETAIYIIRHPAAVMWSYYNYLIDHGGSAELSLDHVINGDVFPGDWGTHVNWWISVGRHSHTPFISIRYEDIHSNMPTIIEQMSELLGIQIRTPSDTSFPGFRSFKEKDPTMYRSGNPHSWKNHLSDEHQKMIKNRYGRVMSKFNYSI